MWEVVRGQSGQEYYFVPSDSSLKKTGGSCALFKGISLLSLQKVYNDRFLLLRDVLDYEEVYAKEGLQFVAIKWMKPHLTKSDEIMKMWDMEKNFLSTHNNVMQVVDSRDVILDDRISFRHIMMKWVDGVTLRKVKLKDYKHFLSLFKQCLLGLKEIHSRNLIHRDIKPDNILISHASVVKIIDLALMIPVDRDTVGHEFRGTPSYASPEQLRCERLLVNTDIWSLGIVFYELLYGSKPFKSNEIRELQQKQRAYRETMLQSNIKSEEFSFAKSRHDSLKIQIQNLHRELIGNGSIDFDKSLIISMKRCQKNQIKKVLRKSLNQRKIQGERYQSVDEILKDLKQPCCGIIEYWPHILAIIFLTIGAILLIWG